MSVWSIDFATNLSATIFGQGGRAATRLWRFEPACSDNSRPSRWACWLSSWILGSISPIRAAPSTRPKWMLWTCFKLMSAGMPALSSVAAVGEPFRCLHLGRSSGFIRTFRLLCRATAGGSAPLGHHSGQLSSGYRRGHSLQGLLSTECSERQYPWRHPLCLGGVDPHLLRPGFGFLPHLPLSSLLVS